MKRLGIASIPTRPLYIVLYLITPQSRHDTKLDLYDFRTGHEEIGIRLDPLEYYLGLI